MKSTLDKLEGLSRKLNIEVPVATVNAAFDRVYKGIQKNATIKGFRKGKAPMNVIRSTYGDEVKRDVIEEIVSESYSKALEEHSLDPIGYPKIKFDQLLEDQVFSFTADLEIRPEVQLKKYEGLKIQKEKLEIKDEQIDEILTNIRQSQAETAPVFEDRPATSSDTAEIDFAGKMNGQPLENGSAQGFMLELGSSRFIPGFEEGIVGMRVGSSKVLNLKFPDEYHVPMLAGQPVEFEVTLKSLKKKVLPELNDELAAKVGNYKTMTELKEAIRKDIESNETKRITDDLRNRVLKALVKENPIQVPRSLMLQQKEVLIKDVQDRMKQQGLQASDFEEYKQKWDGDFEQTASFMVASTFLIDAISDKLKVKPTEADVNQKISDYAQKSGIELSKIQDFYREPERKSRLMFQLTEEKIVDFLVSKANVLEVPKAQLEDAAEGP